MDCKINDSVYAVHEALKLVWLWFDYRRRQLLFGPSQNGLRSGQIFTCQYNEPLIRSCWNACNKHSSWWLPYNNYMSMLRPVSGVNIYNICRLLLMVTWMKRLGVHEKSSAGLEGPQIGGVYVKIHIGTFWVQSTEIIQNWIKSLPSTPTIKETWMHLCWSITPSPYHTLAHMKVSVMEAISCYTTWVLIEVETSKMIECCNHKDLWIINEYSLLLG